MGFYAVMTFLSCICPFMYILSYRGVPPILHKFTFLVTRSATHVKTVVTVSHVSLKGSFPGFEKNNPDHVIRLSQLGVEIFVAMLAAAQLVHHFGPEISLPLLDGVL